MAVAFDAKGAFASGTPGGNTIPNYTNLTVVLNTNGAILFFVALSDTGSTAPAIGSVTGYTFLGAQNGLAGTNWVRVELWGKVGNSTGAQTISLSGSGFTSATNYVISAMSVTGASQVGGTTTFANFTPNSGTTANITTGKFNTSANDLAAGIGATQDTINSPNHTALYTDTTANPSSGAQYDQNDATSPTHLQWGTGGALITWVAAGVNIVAAGAAAAPPNGWFNPLDGYQPRRWFPHDPMAATLVPATLPVPISGMGWFAPRDQDPPRPPYRQPPPAANPDPPSLLSSIQGEGWFNPPDIYPLRRSFTHELAWDPQAFAAQSTIAGMAWFQPWDVFPPRPPYYQPGPGLALTPATLPVGIAGMAWFEPPDPLPLPPPKPHPGPAIALVDPRIVSRIQGIGWFNPLDIYPPKRWVPHDPMAGSLTPATLPVSVSGAAWFAPWDIYPPKRWFPHDPMAATLIPATLPVAVAGMVWFEPPDNYPPRRWIPHDPMAYGHPPFLGTQISGMAWFAPWDVFPPKPPYYQPPAAINLTPATLPVGVSGMAWFLPPEQIVMRYPVPQGPPAYPWQPIIIITPTPSAPSKLPLFYPPTATFPGGLWKGRGVHQ